MQKSWSPSWPHGRPCRSSRMWRCTSPLARPRSRAAWRVLAVPTGSQTPRNTGRSREIVRKVCLSLQPAIWWCPAASFSCWESGRPGWSPVKRRMARLWTLERGRNCLIEAGLDWFVWWLVFSSVKSPNYSSYRKQTSESYHTVMEGTKQVGFTRSQNVSSFPLWC